MQGPPADLARATAVPSKKPQTSVQTMGATLLEGDLYLRIAARCGRIDSLNDALNVRPKLRPLLLAENHDHDPATRTIEARHSSELLLSGHYGGC